jgi:putative tricarboxylic transport membrane protein
MHKPTFIANKSALTVGLALILVAALTAWDASTMRLRAGYGIGPEATSYLVAVILAVLGFLHLPLALKRSDVDVEQADWSAVGWVAIALASLIGSVTFGGGFILGSTLLFAFTARAFGRRSLVIDLAIGLVLAILVFLLFNKLLSLTLPMGPLERLF